LDVGQRLSGGFRRAGGFSSGNGTFVQLSSSGNPGAVATRDTDTGNTGGTGVWEWHVHNGIVTERPHVGTASVIINAVNDAGHYFSCLCVFNRDRCAAVSTGGQLTVTDVDSPATFVAQAGTSGLYGTFALASDGTWTYVMDGAHDAFVAGQQYVETFAVTSADGTAGSVTVRIERGIDSAIEKFSNSNPHRTAPAAKNIQFP
jgi:VCBS repeat-containing protein